MNAPLASGFADAALQSQHVFRTIMAAMARPGRIERLAVGVDAPAPLEQAAAASLLTLCDFETSLWIAPALAGAASWLRFQTDARIAAEAGEAGFALVEAAGLDLARFAIGTPAYPDRGATVIVQCPALEGGPELTLAGPGIAATQRFAVAGLPEDFAAQARANRARFPLGVDLIFASGNALLALPRSARILEAS